MAKTQLLTAKGTRDLPPEEKILFDKIEKTITHMFEVFGFSPMETPVLERYDLLASKYAGGAEILKETFKLTDQGGRELGLRYDLTVPLCRFIGMNPTIKLPFKRYQIGTIYRDGPVASDRMRSFTQCDVDIVGPKSMAADAECILLAEAIFRKLKIAVTIEVNNRKFLDGVLEDIGVPQEKWTDAILVIDKMKKIDQQLLEKELENAGLTKKQTQELFSLLKNAHAKQSNEQKLTHFKKRIKSTIGKQGLEELEQLFACIPASDKKNIVFAPTLSRGLAYYTGTVYEVIALHEEVQSTITAGGRYDKMIQQFLESPQEYPAVGISFGLDRIFLILESRMKEKEQLMQKTVTELFVVPINTEKQSRLLTEKFREAGIKTETDLMGRGPSKNLQYANSLGIPFVLFVGADELKKKKYKLKDMKTGKESLMTMNEIEKEIAGIRKK